MMIVVGKLVEGSGTITPLNKTYFFDQIKNLLASINKYTFIHIALSYKWSNSNLINVGWGFSSVAQTLAWYM